MASSESVTTCVSARWEPGVCKTHKRAFRTKRHAKRALKAQVHGPGAQIPKRRARNRYVYLCRCGYWHLSSQKPRGEG